MVRLDDGMKLIKLSCRGSEERYCKYKVGFSGERYDVKVSVQMAYLANRH